MIFAGAESARFRSDPRFPVPGTAAVPVCASAAVADCLYVHEISSMRDAAACPADCCPPAFCRVLPARQVTAACFLPPVRRVDATCRFAWRRRCLAFLALRHPHCSRLLLLLPAFSRCSRPLPPRAGTPRKSNGAAVVRMRRRWGICLPLFGEFPGSPAGVGLGPQP